MRIAPLMITRYEKIGKMRGPHGKLPMSIRKIYIAIIKFSISFYESYSERSIDDYIEKTNWQIKSEWSQNMLLRQQTLSLYMMLRV